MNWNGCPSGKIAFPTGQAAWESIKRRNSSKARFTHKARGTCGNAYRCSVCGHWHITKNEERGRNRRSTQRAAREAPDVRVFQR